jgi:hypothetical protein
MIKFSGEVVTDRVQDGLGFSGENEEVLRRGSLNCTTLTRECPKNSKSLIKVA